MQPFHKDQEIRATSSFNLPRNIVALQVVVCTNTCVLNWSRKNFIVLQVTEKNLLEKAELGSTLRNMLPKVATLTFVA